VISDVDGNILKKEHLDLFDYLLAKLAECVSLLFLSYDASIQTTKTSQEDKLNKLLNQNTLCEKVYLCWK